VYPGKTPAVAEPCSYGWCWREPGQSPDQIRHSQAEALVFSVQPNQEKHAADTFSWPTAPTGSKASPAVTKAIKPWRSMEAREAKQRLGSLEVYHQIEFCRPQDRQVGGLFALRRAL
jgi:hypothetical protein